MKEKTSKNLQLNLLLTIMSGILGFISNKYFSKYLGIDNLGLMKLFSQLIAYLSLADLGIGSAATYALYKPFLEKDINKLNLIISTINLFYKNIAKIILITGLLVNLIMPLLLKIKVGESQIYIYWSLYVLNTSITYIFAKYSIIFIANQEYGFLRKVSGFLSIISQMIQILLLIYIQSFLLYILINTLNNLLCFYFYKKHFKANYSYIKEVKDKDEDVIKNIKNMFCHKIAGLVVSNTDYIVLVKFTDLSIVAKYSSYLMVNVMIMALIGVVTSVITPLIGKFIASHRKKEIYNYWEELYSLYLFLGIIAVLCVYKLITPFIMLWLGENYILPKYTVILIMINLFISITRCATDIFKDCSGFFKDIYTPLFESLINLVISLILVKKIGLNGVIIGTISSNLIIIYICKPILVFRYCFNKTASDYLKKLIYYMMFTFVIIVLNELLINYLHLNFNILTWIEFLKMSLKIGLITIIVAFVIFMLDISFRTYILSLLKKKLTIKN